MNELMIPLSTANISTMPKNHRILLKIDPGVIVPDRSCRNTGSIARINNDRKITPRIIFIINRLNPGCRYFRKLVTPSFINNLCITIFRSDYSPHFATLCAVPLSYKHPDKNHPAD